MGLISSSLVIKSLTGKTKSKVIMLIINNSDDDDDDDNNNDNEGSGSSESLNCQICYKKEIKLEIGKLLNSEETTLSNSLRYAANVSFSDSTLWLWRNKSVGVGGHQTAQ